MGFSIKNLLNEETLKTATETSGIVKIDYQKLIPNEKNIYHIDPTQVQDLADDIEYNGLLQNLVVKPLDDDTYKIIAGHKRWNATKELVEKRNLPQFASVPCLILDKYESEEETLFKLHTTNLLTRTITEYEKMEAIKELKTLYQKLSKMGKKPKGKIRNLISEQVGLQPTQVQKYMTIAEKADDDTLRDLKDNVITVEEAYQQAKEPDEPAPSEEKDVKPQKEKAPKDVSKEIKKSISKLRELVENADDEELFELVSKMEVILLNRQ